MGGWEGGMWWDVGGGMRQGEGGGKNNSNVLLHNGKKMCVNIPSL